MDDSAQASDWPIQGAKTISILKHRDLILLILNTVVWFGGMLDAAHSMDNSTLAVDHSHHAMVDPAHSTGNSNHTEVNSTHLTCPKSALPVLKPLC